MEAHELLNYKNWVVVGDVANSSKYAFRILHALENSGFNVQGVNPRAEEKNIYKSLKDVPYNIDVIDLCINPAAGMHIIEEAVDIGITKILIQPGAQSADILNFCMKNNITAIEGCALVELSSMKN